MANGKCEQARIEQPNARSRALGSVAVMERLGFFVPDINVRYRA